MKRLPTSWINTLPSIKLIILSIFMGFYLILSMISLSSISLDSKDTPQTNKEVNLTECNCPDKAVKDEINVLP